MKIDVSQPLALQGALNVRELGGYPARDGRTTRARVFLRGDSTANLTQVDVQALLAYGVRCVIDLRSESEIAAAPSALKDRPGVAYYPVSMLDEVASKGYSGQLPTSMSQVYIGLLDHSGPDFARIMEILAAHLGQVTLFHCTAGKDRTGVTAMLLLGLAGVPRPVIVADYAASEANMRPLFEKQKAQIRQAYGIAPPDAVFSSAPCEMEKALDHLERTWGTAEQYLLAAGAAPQTLQAIRQALAG